jgi:hypothetical protein
MGELRPGTFTRIFSEVQREGQLKARRALTGVALAVERQAKINASVGSHKRGTRTPASRGTGPAVISGTLRRSISHSPIVFTGGGWETKVGTAVGFQPPYGRTPASKYGFYLETGLKNGSVYPFLGPAVAFGARVVAPQLYVAIFRAGWPHF